MTTHAALSTSPYVVYASQAGAKLDSDVYRGGGTDDTEALQAVLDKAPALGNLVLVMDGPAMVRGLRVHSNTTIHCLTPACGFYLADGANAPILRNANPHRFERRDRNITLLGGTYNHNCLNQEHHLADNTWVVGLAFFGVENLTIRDLTIRNQRTFAMFVTNWYRVTMENITIELPDRIHAGNQDGLHFQGPGQFLYLRNIQGCSWDDFIALNADDGNADLDASGNLTWNDLLGAHASFGPITDVIIDGVVLHDAAQGIRLLSRASRLDRVVIRNVIGTYRSFGFYITPWLLQDPRQTVKRGGNIGHVVFDTVDLRHTAPNYDYTPPFLFHADGRVDSLTLRNLHHHEPADTRPIVHICKDADIGALTVEGLAVSEKDATAAESQYIQVDGRVGMLTIRGCEVRRGANVPQKGSILAIGHAESQPAIGHLCLSDINVQRMANVINQRAGTIGRLVVRDVVAEELGGRIAESPSGGIHELIAEGVHGAPLR